MLTAKFHLQLGCHNSWKVHAFETTIVCKASEQKKNHPEMELNKKDMKFYVNLPRAGLLPFCGKAMIN